MAAAVHVSDRVKVVFGLDEAEGDVLAVYGSGSRTNVRVAVHIEGADDTFLVTYPADAVARADAA